MKGIILAGGEGTRLRPLTYIANKHLLPIYDKPMIQYPLETLKALGIKDILIVSGGDHIGRFAEYLGDGSQFEVNITYKVQMKAGGIAEALALASGWAGNERVAVILGDNIFDNNELKDILVPNIEQDNAVLVLNKVKDPSRFGVPVFEDGEVVAIEEKPTHSQSEYAITGLYIYPPDVFDIIPTLDRSKRGEIEITDVNNVYINKKRCRTLIYKGFWSDAGTHNSLIVCNNWAHKTKTPPSY